MAYQRDYKKERKYDSKPEVMAKRAARNRARRLMVKLGKAHPGDGLQVDHKNGNALVNSRSNLQVISTHANESYPRTKGAHKKNPKD